jgi:hypothetical protein
MTALERARGWFIAPPEATGDDESAWCRFGPPVPAAPEPGRQPSQTPGIDARDVQPPSVAEPPPPVSPALRPPASAHHGWQPPVPGPGAAERGTRPEATLPPVIEAAPLEFVGTREVTSAAVLGRAGEVEPVAAALALALRRQARAATASVGVVGAALPDFAEGGGAARRLGERLEQHGFEVRVRGRLAWVRLDPADGRLAAAASRLALTGAPAVLAVSAPRNAETDSALVDCDLLVVVASDPEGPLPGLAASGLTGVPLVTVRPLGRGPARALARAGIRSTRSIRPLLSIDKERR